MTFHIDWDDPQQRILRVTYPQSWDWEDLYAAEDVGNARLAQVDHACGGIHDMRSFSALPPHAIPHLRNLTRRMHPNAKVTVLVGISPFVRVIWKTFEKVMPGIFTAHQFMLADDLDEARAYIRYFLDAWEADEAAGMDAEASA